jgi:hypothetical protein
MRRFGLLCGFMGLLIGTPGYGQPPAKVTRAPPERVDPRELRNERDRIVAVTGESIRDFVETYGEDAVVAIANCSQDVARKLGDFPGWKTFPCPGNLLKAIGQPNHGDDVAMWALTHADELSDRDYFDAFVSEPLSYALSLKKLSEGAANVQRFRAALETAKANRQASERNKLIFFCALMAGGIFIVRWWKREGTF